MLEDYMNLILEYNQHINLTAIREKEDFIKKHYIDSLSILNIDEYNESENIIDLGTGGGFPGVPLAIMCPDKDFVLVDSLRKRVDIVEKIIEEVGVFNCIAVHGRAEELGRNKEFREYFDICVSRAVADLSVLSEYCLPFVKKEGYFIPYKGSNIDEEIEGSKPAIKTLGGKISRIENTGFDGTRHSLVIIRKIKNTPKKYPRNPGKPGKEPIKH